MSINKIPDEVLQESLAKADSRRIAEVVAQGLRSIGTRSLVDDSLTYAPQWTEERIRIEKTVSDAISMARNQLRTEAAAGELTLPSSDWLVAQLQTRVSDSISKRSASSDCDRSFLSLFDKYSTWDWVGWIASAIKTALIPKRVDFTLKRDLTPNQLASTTDASTVAVMGDWGSAAYGAPIIARHLISSENLSGVVHLGDTYYTGTESEIISNALNYFYPIMQSYGQGFPIRAILGNHEMYSGGVGYFRTLLPAIQQEGSVFALAAPGWMIVGLDTGFHCSPSDQIRLNRGVNSLHKGAPDGIDQVELVHDLMDKYPDKLFCLMMHHQPFSYLEDVHSEIDDQLSELVQTGRVKLILFAHEHNAIIYNKRKDVYYRCIGHGGIPEKTRQKINNSAESWYPVHDERGTQKGLLLQGPNNNACPEDRNDYAPHGFVTYRFYKGGFEERFISANQRIVRDSTDKLDSVYENSYSF